MTIIDGCQIPPGGILGKGGKHSEDEKHYKLLVRATCVQAVNKVRPGITAPTILAEPQWHQSLISTGS